MKIGITFIVFLLMVMTEISSQVIYERTYSQISPLTTQYTIQLSDTSSICFSSIYECDFGPFHHIDKNGNTINSMGFSIESTHSTGARTIGLDSILVWNREGPTDYDGPNYLRISLWTPSEYITLVLDSIPFTFGADRDVPYGAYLLNNDKLVYRKADTLYTVQISTQQLLSKVIIPLLGHVQPFLKYIVAFSDTLNPIIYSIDLTPIGTWDFNQHPVNNYEWVTLDSFLIGVNVSNNASLHVVNGLTEVSLDLDLSGYLNIIEEIQVNRDGLFVKGKKGAVDYVVQINEQLQVVNETIIDFPFDGSIPLAFYSDRVYGWASDGVSQYQGEYKMAYHYTDANPIRFVDISLDTIWVDSVFLWPHEMHQPANLFLLAEVTNHSTDTIHSFTYHFEDIPFGFCDPGVYARFVDGFSIPPGETGIVPFTTWSWEVAEHKPFARTFYVEHANHHLDDQKADNHFQLTYLISGVNPLAENNLSIWPNPFHDYLESSEDFESLKMYNSLGHVVSSGINRLESLGSLIPGAYYVQGLRNHKIYLTRVIKIE